MYDGLDVTKHPEWFKMYFKELSTIVNVTNRRVKLHKIRMLKYINFLNNQTMIHYYMQLFFIINIVMRKGTAMQISETLIV